MAADSDVGPVQDAADYFLPPATGPNAHSWLKGHGDSTHGAESPLRLWKGRNNSFLKATLKVSAAYFDQSNSWFGKAEENLGEDSKDWWESVIHPGIDGSYFFDKSGELYAQASAVSTSQKDIDAAGSNVGRGDTTHVAVEDAVIGWRSGYMFGSLGKDFLDISFGRQQYTAGTGFILQDQADDGGNRSAFWIGPREAAEYAGIARVKYGRWKGDLLYFKADDNPNTDTKLGGITLDYSLGNIGGIGGGYYFVESEIETRDSMDVYDIRFDLQPFTVVDALPALDPLEFRGEYVYEDNGSKLSAAGWFLSTGYQWEGFSWKPTLTYRYATFEGDNPQSEKSQDFDPLFYGFDDWGYWDQGEVLGEYVLVNTNLNSHMVRLSVAPVDSLHISAFYYNFDLDNPRGFGVESESFADEWNLIVDWTVNEYVSVTAVGAFVDPSSGAKQFTGGDDDWLYGMLNVNLSLK